MFANDAIKVMPESARNVREYAKQQQYWAQVSKLNILLGTHLDAVTIDLEEVKGQTQSGV